MKDSVLWPRVQAEHIFFITADKGFGDLRQFPPGTHAGVLLLRAEKESVQAYLALMQMVLNQHRLDDLVHCLIVATPRSVRVQRARV